MCGRKECVDRMKEKKLTAKQKRCMELLLSGSLNQKQIAAEINVSEQTICNWKKDVLFASEYDSAIRESIRYTAGRALATQIQLLDHADGRVARQAASDLLDRAGYKPTEQVDLQAGVGVTIIDDIADDAQAPV